MFFSNTTIRLMWHGLYVNKVGCYLHVANKPTSKTENITHTKKNLSKRKKISVVDTHKYNV